MDAINSTQWGGGRNAYKINSEKVKGRDNLGDPSVDERTLPKSILIQYATLSRICALETPMNTFSYAVGK
jgi:hypothetical protein